MLNSIMINDRNMWGNLPYKNCGIVKFVNINLLQVRIFKVYLQ